MPFPKKIASDFQGEKPQRYSLDERFITTFLGDAPLDRLEAQEFRQLLLNVLNSLDPQELKVLELRHQKKKSPGQTASLLKIDRSDLQAIERAALAKVRQGIATYMEL